MGCAGTKSKHEDDSPNTVEPMALPNAPPTKNEVTCNTNKGSDATSKNAEHEHESSSQTNSRLETPALAGNDDKQAANTTYVSPHTILCDARWVSHVIGPKAVTLKGLEDSTGASVDIAEDQTLHMIPIIIKGTPVAVSKAVAAIEAIIANAENPDYEGQEGKKWRAEAQHCYEERTRLKILQQEAFDAGDHKKGHAMIADAKKRGEDAVAANSKAASCIFSFNNDGKGDMYIDLHGLKVDEVVH